MRVKRRHGWAAALLALFALPVLKPEGFPGLEGRIDALLNWPARSRIGAASGADDGLRGDPSAREADLERLLLEAREQYFQALEPLAQKAALTEALGLDRVPQSVAARVIRSKDASSSRRSALIDRGTDDGVRRGLAVAMGGVYVGVVAHAEARSARVQLVDDPHSKTEVAIRTREGERAVGWVRGDDAETLKVRYVRVRDGLTLRAGDPVFTSNAVETVPAGLLVGEVTEAGDPDANGILDVRVRPRRDLERHTHVLVLVPAR